MIGLRQVRRYYGGAHTRMYSVIANGRALRRVKWTVKSRGSRAVAGPCGADCYMVRVVAWI